MTIKASRIEPDGSELCNICSRPVDKPYRYKTASGLERGCVSECHDLYVRRNTLPGWMSKTRYVLPAWITTARRQIRALEIQWAKERKERS